MMGGSSGGTPPSPQLQFGGSAFPGAVTPHPPVFGKPYMGSGMHTLIQDQNTVNQVLSNIKDENKGFFGGTLPSQIPGHGVLPRPITFMHS